MKKPVVTIFLLAIAIICAAGCERRSVAPTAAEQAAILEGAPEIFVGETEAHGPSLAGIGDIYMGQPRDEALAELAKLCPKTMEYRSGESGENAWFRGCVLKEPAGGILSVRVGFWPKLGNQVSTLDIKRDDITLDQARERFRQFIGELSAEYPHPGLVEMRGEKYQMLADIDEGAEGPTHIAFGYTHKWANQHKVSPSKTD